MKTILSKTRRSINWGKGLFVLISLTLLALLMPAILSFSAPARVQPVLAQMAAERPDALVGVIVQKTITDASLEASVARLGGVVTKDLSIINAFAAVLPAGAVKELAMAHGVKWVSLDAPMIQSGGPDGSVNTSNLLNVYNKAIGADRLWAEGYQGSTVTVAVVDSGVAHGDDLNKGAQNVSRVTVDVKFSSKTKNIKDDYGHGTSVAGVIGGNGNLSGGNYIGIAPLVNLINVKVSDDKGRSLTSDVVAALQWVYANRAVHNIRVVNLSLNSTVNESYHVNPLDAALEILWFNKIVVVVAAGNNGGNGAVYPPANDPFVITVGAADDRGTPGIGDDTLGSFSAFGVTTDGLIKPDLVAPGKNIITLAGTNNSELYKEHRANRVDQFGHYFRMSGTSMSAPIVSGAVALLLQSNPNLTPDQIKYRLKATARPFNNGVGVGAGYLDIYAAVHGTTTARANVNFLPSQLLSTGNNPPNWSNVDWGSVDWGSVDWGGVDWGSVDWGSVDWGSDYWGP